MIHNIIGLALLVACLVGLFLARRKLGTFLSASGLLVASLAYVKLGMDPPAPASVVVGYAAILTVAIVLYITSSEANRTAFWDPIHRVMVEKGKRPILYVVLVVVPAVVAWQAFEIAMPASAPPPLVRSVHPSPPTTISFRSPDGEGRTIDLINGDSPQADLEQRDPAAYAEAVATGRRVYYENCFFCHGDNLEADGHYAAGLRPPPANFRDPGVLPMLQHSFLFWRIAKGGAGLPEAGTPWDSVMPVWERFLTEDEIWSVITYMADTTGFAPRAHGAEGH